MRTHDKKELENITSVWTTRNYSEMSCVGVRKKICYLKNDNTFIISVVYFRILSCELLFHCAIYCKILSFRLLSDCAMHCTNCQETTFKHSPTVL